MKPLKLLRSKNHVLNAIIVLTGIILLWKGIGGLLDYYIFPNDPLFGDFTEILLGLSILLLDDFSLSETMDSSDKKVKRTKSRQRYTLANKN